jgi:cell wall-associated protease
MKNRVYLLSFLFVANVMAQDTALNKLKGWHLKGSREGFIGININKAYDFLKNKKSVTVVVGVIDSGIDTLHEDLKAVLWKNPKEIVGNGKDDDGNGLVDDVYGWNFLGGKDGNNIEKASSEKARVYHKYKTKYEGKNVDEALLIKEELYEYTMWKAAAKAIEPSAENAMMLMQYKSLFKNMNLWDSTIKAEANVADYTGTELTNLTFESANGKKAKMAFTRLLQQLPFGMDAKTSMVIGELKNEVNRLADEAKEKDETPIDYRATISKDNYDDINDKQYGNTNIMGLHSMHGTHVAGLIGAIRNNNIGVDGVADNVRLMILRAVPDGDEYDKDIALAIKYAADNGAKVVNMSFGKSYSPEKKWVDDAYKYAASKDVLLIHSAGNDAKNLDSIASYPSIDFLDGGKANNVITVGASSDTSIAENYIADFSNYGAKNVDVFSPGNRIYSTIPGGNTYGFLDGTSMAGPIVAGVAALIRSYYPKLTAVQVKECIEKTVFPLTEAYTTFMPSTKNKVSMKSLCNTGGIVDAFAAVQMAEQMNKKLNPKK